MDVVVSSVRTRIALKTSLHTLSTSNKKPLFAINSLNCRVIGLILDMTEWSIFLCFTHMFMGETNPIDLWKTPSGLLGQDIWDSSSMDAALQWVLFLSFLAICLHSVRGRNDTKGFFFTPDLLWTSVHPSINVAVITCPALRATDLLWLWGTWPLWCDGRVTPWTYNRPRSTCAPTDGVPIADVLGLSEEELTNRAQRGLQCE